MSLAATESRSEELNSPGIDDVAFLPRRPPGSASFSRFYLSACAIGLLAPSGAALAQQGAPPEAPARKDTAATRYTEPIGEPVGSPDVFLHHQTLRFDLRPLAHAAPFLVEARYELESPGAARSVDLVFVLAKEAMQTFTARLDGKPIGNQAVPLGELPQWWREATTGRSGLRWNTGRAAAWAVRLDLSAGRHVLDVSYSAAIEKRDLPQYGRGPITWPVACLLAPRRTWGRVGGLDLEVVCPPGWELRASAALARDGDTHRASFAELPDDFLELKANMTVAELARGVVAGVAFFTLLAVGLIGCVWLGVRSGRKAKPGGWALRLVFALVWAGVMVVAGRFWAYEDYFRPEELIPPSQKRRPSMWDFTPLFIAMGLCALPFVLVPATLLVGWITEAITRQLLDREATTGPHDDIWRTTMSRAATEYRYEKLTWPEINDAVDLGKVCIVPCGSVEQHGPHLPLDVDIVCPQGIAFGAGRAVADKLLVLPPVWYGYTAHVMDFPGTINTHYATFIDSVLDIAKSLAYHGFKKIVLLNGHGSNMPNLDLAARRANLETDAECVVVAWWHLLTVDKGFMPRWRQSKFPGGCAHACELETSLYQYLDGDNVRTDRIKSGDISFNEEGSPFNWVDLFSAGPATVISWTSSYSETGVLGEAELATAEKGREVYEEAVKQLVRFVTWWKDRPKDVRGDRHCRPPTMPMPWGQRPIGG